MDVDPPLPPEKEETAQEKLRRFGVPTVAGKLMYKCADIENSTSS